jgi:hypothetical protein
MGCMKKPVPKAVAALVMRQGELGQEKLCKRCVEWWPADTTFWFSDPKGAGGLYYMCKACYADWELANKAKKAGAPMHPPITSSVFHLAA